MRLPTLEELEAVDSAVVTTFQQANGITPDMPLDQRIKNTLANMESMADENAVCDLLPQLPRFQRLVELAVANAHCALGLELFLAHAVLFGLRVGYTCGQADALKLVSELSVDK